MREMSTDSPPASPQESPSHIEVEEITTIIKTPMLRPTPAFRKVIHFGGGRGETFTLKEMIDHVQKYIEDRKLYDENNPSIVYCKGNDLEAAFNVESFTVYEVRKLFLQHCFQEADSHLRINRQVRTRPISEKQSTSSSQGVVQESSSVSLSSPSSSLLPERKPTDVKLKPAPAFLKVIHLGGGVGQTFTMNEIMDCVKKYIEDRKLYDEQDPHIVYCKGNDLGSAFGVNTFMISPDLKNLFKRHCIPLTDHQNQVSHRQDEITSSLENHQNLSSQRVLQDELPTSPHVTSTSSVISSSSSSSLMSSSSSSVASSSRPESKSVSHKNLFSTCTKAPSTTAAHPSTTLTRHDLEIIEMEGSPHLPSTSVSVTALDETDGDPLPWSCQVTVDVGQQGGNEESSQNSLVVEYSSDNFSVEYELVSSSEPEPIPNSGDTEESERSPSNSAALYLVCEESDIEYLADYSDTDTESDAELKEEDKWQCTQCGFRNCALHRNCSKCWCLRPDWLPSSNMYTFPSEPDKSKGADSTTASLVESECPSPTACPFPSFSQDSAIGSMACSQEQMERDVNINSTSEKVDAASDNKLVKQENSDVKRKIRSKKRTYSSCLSDSQEEIVDRKSKTGKVQQVNCKKEEKESNQSPTDPCVICLTRARTACIIHGKTGHQVCCYKCGRRLKKQRKSCPICRRPIQKVVRNYF